MMKPFPYDPKPFPYEPCYVIKNPEPPPSSFSCYVIVTCRSMLWTLLTIVASLFIVASVITPQWLVGRPHWMGLRSKTSNLTVLNNARNTYNPTIGIFNRCTKIRRYGGVYKDHCATYVTGFDMPSDEFSNFWKSSLIFFGVSTALLGVTVLSAVLSLCVRAVCKKSIFTVSGLIQSIAGLFLIVAMMLYPAGWGSHRVKALCGEAAAPYILDECSLGWAFYSCIGGTLLVFVCAILSIQAEISTSSDKIEDEILKGRNLICIP